HAAGALRTPEPFDTWLPKRLAQRRQHPSTPVLHQIDDGRWVRGFEMPTPDGGLVGVRLDVSELVQQQSRAEAATRQLQEAIDALPDGFALYDADDRLAVFNRRYRELYAASAPAIRVGATFEEILRHGLAHGQYPDAAGHEDDWLAERLYRHRNPGPPQLQQLPGNRWLRIDERRTADGGLAGVRTDVTELVQREQELQRLNARLDELNAQLTQLSDTDALTGVANRRQFDRRLAEEWARAARHAAPLSLLLVDVDHFKRFNDARGHPRGDECLRALAQALHGCARRATDVVARYGGEEFAVLLPYADAREAHALAEHCLAAVDALHVEHGDSPVGPHVTISVGVATTVPTLMDGPGSLLRDADRALYRAKQAGRHRAVAAAAA
nr:diguanylate cyclase [Burkholderiaceae bacterium]